MPRISDIESSSSSDSDSDSDSSSVHSIPHDAAPRQSPATSTLNRAEYATDVFVSRESHVSGRLVDNRAKRKIEDTDDGIDGHTSKTRRLRSQSQLFLAFDADQPDDSDYDDDAAEDERSESDLESVVESDMELVTSDVHQPQTQSQSQSQSQSQTIKPHLHPAFPRTAFQLLRQTIPYVRAKRRDVPDKLRFIMDLPVRQVPVLRRTFQNYKRQNIPSYLIQATGELLSPQASCDHCRKQNGVYQGCVVSRDPIVNQVFRGACAGCWYGRQGSRCTLRYTSENEPSSENNTPITPEVRVPASLPALLPSAHPATYTQLRATPQARREPAESVPSGRKETPILPPVYHHPKPAVQNMKPLIYNPANGHPSPAPAQAQARSRQPTALTNVQHAKAPGPVPAEILMQVMLKQERMKEEIQKQGVAAVESKIDSWTKRYDRMPMTDLLAAHKHLIEWNEDCNARLSAMVNVLAKRCLEFSQENKK